MESKQIPLLKEEEEGDKDEEVMIFAASRKLMTLRNFLANLLLRLLMGLRRLTLLL